MTPELPQVERGRLLIPALAPFYSLAERVGYAGLRVWFAATLLTHGWPKLLRLSHGGKEDAYTRVIARIGGEIGLPAPVFFGNVVMLLETAGAFMLGFGLFTRIIAPMLAIEMLVIAVGLSWPVWAWTEHGMEYPLFMAAVAGYMSFRGGGPFSLDRRIGREL